MVCVNLLPKFVIIFRKGTHHMMDNDFNGFLPKGALLTDKVAATTKIIMSRQSSISLTLLLYFSCAISLQWRNNGCDGVSTHRRLDGLLNRLFRRRSKKTSKLRVTGLCGGNVSIWWRHHVASSRTPFTNRWWHGYVIMVFFLWSIVIHALNSTVV